MTLNNRSGYLSEPSVRRFIQWTFPLLDTPGALIHEYRSRKPKVDFRCVSIHDAYQKYFWTASFNGPDGRHYSGKGKEDNEQALDMLSSMLRRSVAEDDVDLCLRACIAIQDWGGTRMNNIDNINRIGQGIVNYLRDIQERLDPDKFELGQWQNRNIVMTSGFSKIYALLLDDFLIYDSRVAAALCLLVRRYCLENNLPSVPEALRFALGAGRSEANRNPGCAKYKFPKMTYTNTVYLDSNMRANWLMRGLLEYGENSFISIPGSKRLLALGNALFMIGYEV